MKQLAQAISERDGLKLSLIANNHPQKKPEQIPQQAIDIFNSLFKQLRATFPAMMATIKDQEQLDELRRQWVKAIAENEIYQVEQIEAGMRMARKHEKPFLPSPGEFISWCKSGCANSYGLPDADSLYESVMKFRAQRFRYSSIEEYPWDNDAQYWLVTAVSAKMTAQSLTVGDTLKVCEHEIKALSNKLSDGFCIPKPVAQVEKKHVASSPEVAQKHLANIRAMLKAKQ